MPDDKFAESLKTQEKAIDALAALYARRSDVAGIAALLPALGPLLARAPKAKTARVVRTLIDHVGKCDEDGGTF